MSNLFVQLAKFRGRPERSSIENFFTELVAEILRREKAILNETLRILLRGSQAVPGVEHFDVRTQHPTRSRKSDLSGLRLDLVLECPMLRVIIENKVDSPLTKGQLERYLDYAEEIGASKVAVISRDRCPEAERCDHRLFLGSFFWSDLANAWSARRESVSNQYLLKGVLEFMKEQDMGPTEPFDQEELRAPALWTSFSRKVHALMSCLPRRLEPIGDPGDEKDLDHRDLYGMGPGPLGRLNEPGLIGTLWSSPVDKPPGDRDFWYFVGVAYSPYVRWWLRPVCTEEPEAVVAVGMWLSGPLSNVDEFQAQLYPAVEALIAEGFEVARTENLEGVMLFRRRALREFLAEADSAGRIIEFLESSHRTLVASEQIPRLHELIRRQRGPLPSSA
ncbi:MAG: PD-(D/E)XK nuclease family protein [Acidobacteria bacterium]|jgi:hypothetical protein|nr:PD-(D/E)XK nuclease family protein [Acidobacteriota bacterium]